MTFEQPVNSTRTLSLILAAAAALSACSNAEPTRSFEFRDEIRIAASKGRTRLWIPVPPSDAYQSVELVEVRSEHPHRVTRESEFGNKMIYVESDGSEPFSVEARYRVTRRTQNGLKQGVSSALSATERDLYTSPRGLLAVDDRIRKLARKHGGASEDPLKISRAYYDYILSFMSYDKKSKGWGNGDSLRACVVGLGNCTDFHSLFQSMAMVRDIPSRFRMGLPLSSESSQSFTKGYHCWVEFHADQRGWVPMDISEAWKVMKGKKKMDSSWKDRYFGTLDPDRLLLSTGRDIRLEPPQKGKRLNYFAYPYLEVAGSPSKDMEFKRVVQDL